MPVGPSITSIHTQAYTAHQNIVPENNARLGEIWIGSDLVPYSLHTFVHVAVLLKRKQILC